MAIFGPKPWVNPFGKMSIFRLFEVFVFIAWKGVFSFQNMVKDIFLAYIAKKKHEKWPFLDFLNFLFLQLRKVFLRSIISQKNFSRSLLPKKKFGKKAISGRKPWVNPFQKHFNFSTFSTSFCYSLGSRFAVLEYCERHFPGLYSLKKTFDTWPFLDKDHKLTPFEKCLFFNFLNFLFLQPGKAFFCSRIL